MADIELKPCPFCGSKDIELRAGIVFNGAAHCKNCSADVVFDAVRMIAEGDYDWKTAVTNGWNNRAEDVVPRSEGEKAKQEVAREIFAEIENIFIDGCEVYHTMEPEDFYELKKKYIGE